MNLGYPYVRPIGPYRWGLLSRLFLPVALKSRPIAEKYFLQVMDENPSREINQLTYYWMTDSVKRGIVIVRCTFVYMYRVVGYRRFVVF